MSIALCIVAKHSPESFQRLIDSAWGNVQEILVAVDEGAANGIYGYRNQDGVRYWLRSTSGDFAAQRNFLIEQASSDWILTLDTDEALPAQGWAELRERFVSEPSDQVYCLPRRNVIENVSDALSWPDWQPRIYRRNHRWEGRIHEEIAPGVPRFRLEGFQAIEHRKTAQDQRNAIASYVKIQGLKDAVVIFEWQRPKYLQICLDSLHRAKGIERWPILLSLDGGDADAFSHLFPMVTHFIPWEKHAGNLWHVTRTIEFAFSAGYERILFMDGDTIVRPDIFAAIPEKGRNDVFICNVTHDLGPVSAPWLHPTGNFLAKEEALPLLNYVNTRQWVGKKRPGFGDQKLHPEYPGYDAVYCRYLLDYWKTSRYRDRSYVGHIGVCGVDCSAPDIEKEMFTGPETQWLDNAVKLFDHQRHFAFSPPDFRYED